MLKNMMMKNVTTFVLFLSLGFVLLSFQTLANAKEEETNENEGWIIEKVRSLEDQISTLINEVNSNNEENKLIKEENAALKTEMMQINERLENLTKISYKKDGKSQIDISVTIVEEPCI